MASISMAPNQRMYNNIGNSDSSSMSPSNLDGNLVFSTADTPAKGVIQKNPNHIFINQTGSYSFQYECDGLPGAAAEGTYNLGMTVLTTGGTPVKLDIQPCAWSGSAGGLVGDVTFVYKGQ